MALTFPEFPPEIARLKDGVSLLGSPLWGTPDFFNSTIAHLVDAVHAIQAEITELDDPQVGVHLLRSCLGVGKINHILRTVPLQAIRTPLARFDYNLRQTLSKVTRSTISDLNWLQASLPFRLGGLGLRQALPNAHAAYIASCYASRDVVSQLLPSSLDLTSISLPGEASAFVALNASLELPLPVMTQSALQAPLDDHTFDDLLSQVNIRDRARLRTLSESPETSGWLRAVPISNLGLSMPGPEFMVSLRIWLGIPIFTSTSGVRCACGIPIDVHGDHLLGCGYGPLRIRRHDSLCNIIWHALLQDSPNAKREQRISGDSKTRPGDVYHPDFTDGHPTFFDVSVCSTLQPNHVNKASTTAGAAAVEGEIQKDSKHRLSVEQHGGSLFPLWWRPWDSGHLMPSQF